MKLKINTKQYHFLVNHKIYIKPAGILSVGEELFLEPDMQIEAPCYIAGRNIYSMGAFSYSHSAFPCNTEIGRYCSIAKNVRVFGDDHPQNRFTTSAVTYKYKLSDDTSVL